MMTNVTLNQIKKLIGLENNWNDVNQTKNNLNTIIMYKEKHIEPKIIWG